VQPQHLTYVSHRHSLTWHPGLLLLGRDKANPWLKTVSGTDPVRPPTPPQPPRRCSRWTGNHVQDQAETVFTIYRIQRSRWTGLRTHPSNLILGQVDDVLRLRYGTLFASC